MMSRIRPIQDVRQLQSKAYSLDMPFHMFVLEWIVNDKKYLKGKACEDLTITERNDIIRAISLNIYWQPVILLYEGYDDEAKQVFTIIRGSKVIDTILGFIKDDNKDTPELIVYSELGSTDVDWIESRKLRIIIYENLTEREKIALKMLSAGVQ